MGIVGHTEPGKTTSERGDYVDRSTHASQRDSGTCVYGSGDQAIPTANVSLDSLLAPGTFVFPFAPFARTARLL